MFGSKINSACLLPNRLHCLHHFQQNLPNFITAFSFYTLPHSYASLGLTVIVKHNGVSEWVSFRSITWTSKHNYVIHELKRNFSDHFDSDSDSVELLTPTLIFSCLLRLLLLRFRSLTLETFRISRRVRLRVRDFSTLISARARAVTNVISAGERDSTWHSTTIFSENVVVAKTIYVMLVVSKSCYQERDRPPAI